MNPSTAQATALVDELVANGITEAVLAPGSRSAPLAFALHAADAAGRLRLHVRIDERGAGFLALGMAKASGQPVVVVTTSGTAVANLHPAVLEAHHGGVPLLVLSADRPPHLRGVGANQVIDQMTVFGGDCLRYRHEIAVAGASPRETYVRGQVCRAVAAARGAFASGWAGPAQLNVPFDVPLVPDPATDPGMTAERRRPEPRAGAWTRITPDSATHLGMTAERRRPEPHAAAWTDAAHRQSASDSSGIPGGSDAAHAHQHAVGDVTTVESPERASAGPGSLAESGAGPALTNAGVAANCDAGGAPQPALRLGPVSDGIAVEKVLIIADLESGARAAEIAAAGGLVISEAGGLAGPAVLGAGIHLLEQQEFVNAHRPDRVVVLGRPTLFRSVGALLSRGDVTVDVVDYPARYADASGTVRTVWAPPQAGGDRVTRAASSSTEPGELGALEGAADVGPAHPRGDGGDTVRGARDVAGGDVPSSPDSAVAGRGVGLRVAGWVAAEGEIVSGAADVAGGAVRDAERTVGVVAGWAAAWRRADSAAARAVTGVLRRYDLATSAVLARTVARVLPNGSTLFLGSSQPPRDLAHFAAARGGVRILANRGVAGIDGTVSTAIGVALASARTGGKGPSSEVTGGGTYALMGDLTFVHDVTALAIGPHEPRPDLAIIVANNDGGGIFTTLEQGAPPFASAFERIFGTPTGVQIAQLAEAFGVPHLLATTVDELVDELSQPPEGLRIIEVPVTRTDLRSVATQVAAAVREAITE